MKQYVLDASVAAKWFLRGADETLLEEAMDVLRLHVARQVEFLVPDLFFAELANLLWRAERRGRCDRETTDGGLSRTVGLNMPSYDSGELAPKAVSIARAIGVSVYDGIYLALSEDAGATLLTADEKLARAARGRPVVWLGALQRV